MVIVLTARAQEQVPNSGFDNWKIKNNHAEPIGWNSLMTADRCTFCSFGISQRVFPEQQGLPGKGTCLRIESSSILGGIIVNGTATTGRVIAPTIRPSEGFNQTIPNSEFGLRFSGKPDSLVFWAKYSITDESDSALASFLLHEESVMTDPMNFCEPARPIGIARKTFHTKAEWKRISIPFEYSEKGVRKPRYLLATFSSSFQAGKGNFDATLWVDEVELIYNKPSTSFSKELSQLVN